MGISKKSTKQKKVTYGMAGLLTASLLSASSLTAWAAPAVPEPGESIERPPAADNSPVVEAGTAPAAAVPAGTHFHLRSIAIKHEGLVLNDAELQAITDTIIGKEITAQ